MALSKVSPSNMEIERLIPKVDELLRDMDVLIKESQTEEEKLMQALKSRLIMVQAMVHKRSKEILADLEKQFKDKRESLKSFSDEVMKLKTYHSSMIKNPSIMSDLVERKLDTMRRCISLNYNENDLAKIADVTVSDCFKNNLKKKKIILLEDNVDIKRIIVREDSIYMLKLLNGEVILTAYSNKAIFIKDLWREIGFASDFDIDFERRTVYVSDVGSDIRRSKFSMDGLSFSRWSDTHRVTNIFCMKNGLIIYECGGWYNDYCENIIMLDFEGTEVWRLRLAEHVSINVCYSKSLIATLCGKTPIIYDGNGNPISTIAPQRFDTDGANLLSFNVFGLICAFRNYNKAFRFCERDWKWIPVDIGFKPKRLAVYNDLFETRIYAVEENNKERRLYVFLD
ncbi:unnamed protein product [Dimorphilus gyrociliatus]|uniref:Uncharacterized protein n=1 Tax=Dimorphilus gyrociliatus TaxID=2664684 RepID=A0A7I8VWA6_9ANNE|nr:unnamed protein product [Dimorphilus gyrociliatus]